VKGERAVIRALAPIRRWHPRILPVMTAIGVASALLEGVGLSLFLPFLYSIDAGTFAPTEDSFLGQTFHRALFEIPESHRLLAVSIGIVVLISLKNLLVYANAILDSWVRTLLVHSLRSRIVDQLLRTRADYTESREAGRLVNVLQNQTLEVGRAFASHAQILVNASTAAVFGVFLVLVSWQLALGVGAALLLISSLVRLAWRRAEGRSPAFVKAWDELSQRGLELLQGMRTIQLFGREAYERERFARASHEASRIWLQLELLSGLVRPASEILVVVVVVVALLATLQGASSIPTVLTFALILWRLRPQIQGTDVARAQLLGARASVEAVAALLDPGDKPTLSSGTLPFHGLADSMRFEAVSYRHVGSEEDSLRDVSLAIPAGRTTAVLGLSGAGKSTLVQLLLRVTDPDRGRVLLDGVPLTELDLASWRRGTALVTHDPVLFNATVWDNIAYGLDGAGADAIARAARRAGVDDFIEHLPDGYHSLIGDRGARLSAGQKQRIALARALLREPRLIVLDEATSALDATAEKRALEAVSSQGGRVTVVFVSHRRAVVERADHFVLLDDGRVAAEGDRSVLEGISGAVRGLYGTDTLDDRTPPQVRVVRGRAGSPRE